MNVPVTDALSQTEVEALLVARLLKSDGQCNSGYLNHVSGQIRALYYVLTRKPLGAYWSSVSSVLDDLGIPHTLVDGSLEFDSEWLLSHGFVIDGDDVSHPEFSVDW